MPKRVKKIKVQKQKQKQSQQVIVKIDQSRKTVQRKGKEQPQQQRPNITPIINLPSYPQQQQAPINTQPIPTPTATRAPTPVRVEEAVRTEVEPIRAEVEPIRELKRTTPSIPSAFTGASQRVGNITEPTAPTQFQPEQDYSLGAYMRRQIQPGEAEAAQPLQQEEEEDYDEVEHAELPEQNAQDLITPLLDHQQITASERDYMRSLLTRRHSTKITKRLRQIYNRYL